VLPADGVEVETLDEGAEAPDAYLLEDATRYPAELQVRGSSEGLWGHLYLFGKVILDVLLTLVTEQSNDGL
jgi:hypothetical protein